MKSSPPRRVLIVRQAYYPENLRFEDQARKLVEHGCEVVVLSLRRQNQPRKEVLHGVEVHRVPFSWIRKGPLLYALQYVAFLLIALAFTTIQCFRRRADAILVSNLPDVLVFCALIPKLMGARVVLDIRDPMPETLATRYQLEASHPLCRLAAVEERLSCRFADGVLTVHEPIRDLLLARGVSADKLWVLYNLPDAAEFVQRGAQGNPAVRSRGPLLMFHGTIAHRFGIDTAIRALGQVRHECPGVRFSIYGEGEASSALQKLAEDLGLSDCVIFHGFQPSSVIVQALHAADMAVIPHLRTPGMDIVLPTKLLECMACGIPAIVSRNPVMEGMIPEEAVRFFPAGDQEALAKIILDIYENPDRAAAVALSASQWLARIRTCRYQQQFSRWLLSGTPIVA